VKKSIAKEVVFGATHCRETEAGEKMIPATLFFRPAYPFLHILSSNSDTDNSLSSTQKPRSLLSGKQVVYNS